MSQGLEIFLFAIGGLCTIIGSLIAFIVYRFSKNLSDARDDMGDIFRELRKVNSSQATIERDMIALIHSLDSRVVVVETIVEKLRKGAQC